MRKMKESGYVWIGVIPDEWKIEKVKYAFYRKNKKAMQENPVILSLARNGVRERDISNNEGQIAESYYNYNPVDVDDLLINPMDLYSGANCSISKVKGVISPAYINLRYKEGVSPVFFDYYFKTQYWLMAFFSYGKGVSYDNRWTLNAETLMNYPIVVPSYSEQCRIADYLDSKCSKIDEYIAKQQQLIEKLKEYKQAIITEAVTKGLNPDVPMKDSGIEWIGEIPKHWKIAKVGYVTIKIGSGKTPKGGADVYSDEGVLFLRSQNIYNEGLQVEEAKYITSDIDEEMSNTRVYMNDVLLNITGGSIGRSCIYNLNSYANVNQHVCIIRTNDRLVLPTYMHYFWISHVGQISVDIHQTGANREGLNFEQISKTAIPILSLEEQKEISDYLDKKCLSINSTINQKQEIIDKLTEYKKSLIYEVVTGKKEV